MDCNINIQYTGYLVCSHCGVVTHSLRNTALALGDIKVEISSLCGLMFLKQESNVKNGGLDLPGVACWTPEHQLGDPTPNTMTADQVG